MPDGLQYWTLDEVAECLPVGDELYRKLWKLLDDCTTITPIGGDGSNGTVEYPDARLGITEDDKARQWWNKITPDEQAKVCKAWEERF